MLNDAGPVSDARVVVVERLRARRGELVQAILARVLGEAFDRTGEDDAEYVAGLRATVAAALEYVLAGIERDPEGSGPIPAVALEQAGRAARVGVSLDTVLRRYVVGSAVLGEFVMEEADRWERDGWAFDCRHALREALRAQASGLDRLLAAITAAYGDELRRARRSPEQRLLESVRTLLAGERADGVELGGYELSGEHVGVIARGADARAALRALATGLDRRLLCVACGKRTMWAWFGGQRALDMSGLERACSLEAVDRAGARDDGGGDALAGVSFAVGEPARGLEGWRVTHRQAQAALVVALRRPRRLTRYADVALLASALKDEMLAPALIGIYLSPLDDSGDRGPVLRETLRAHFAAGLNATSAAAKLGVARSTVDNRLHEVEQALGRVLHTCLAELEVALELEALGDLDRRENRSLSPIHSKD